MKLIHRQWHIYRPTILVGVYFYTMNCKGTADMQSNYLKILQVAVAKQGVDPIENVQKSIME